MSNQNRRQGRSSGGSANRSYHADGVEGQGGTQRLNRICLTGHPKGVVPLPFESCERSGAYEYIRRVYDHTYRCFGSCRNSEHEK